jgi:hypothetical protein
MIPPEIIFNDQLGKYVYIIDSNNTLQRADIKTGYATKYYVNVKKGLKDGDRVGFVQDGIEYSRVFRIDERLKGTVALNPCYDRGVVSSVCTSYRFSQAEIKKV